MMRFPPGVVILNVYDVEDHPFNYQLAKLLTLGIHHSGVQVGQKEFSFTLEGIVVTEPRPAMVRCRLTSCQVQSTHVSADVVHRSLSKLQHEFTPSSYDPINRNCNHFSAAFVNLLTGGVVPAWINRAPTVAGLLGTKFRLQRARNTAPPVSWSVLLPVLDGSADDDVDARRPTRKDDDVVDARRPTKKATAWKKKQPTTTKGRPGTTTTTAPGGTDDPRKKTSSRWTDSILRACSRSPTPTSPPQGVADACKILPEAWDAAVSQFGARHHEEPPQHHQNDDDDDDDYRAYEDDADDADVPSRRTELDRASRIVLLEPEALPPHTQRVVMFEQVHHSLSSSSV